MFVFSILCIIFYKFVPLLYMLTIFIPFYIIIFLILTLLYIICECFLNNNIDNKKTNIILSFIDFIITCSFFESLYAILFDAYLPIFLKSEINYLYISILLSCYIFMPAIKFVFSDYKIDVVICTRFITRILLSILLILELTI